MQCMPDKPKWERPYHLRERKTHYLLALGSTPCRMHHACALDHAYATMNPEQVTCLLCLEYLEKGASNA